MELQLCLALPGINPVKKFDLNNNFVFDPQDHHLITNQSSSNPYCFLLPTHTATTTTATTTTATTFEDVNTKKKRSFCQAFLDHNETVPPPTLPLLLWNNHPNDDEDDLPKHLHNCSSQSSINIKEEGDGDGVVGWPPVKPWRKKCVWWHGFNNGSGRTTVENGCGCGGRVSNSMYVKVKMDGVAIARKVDLSLHHSFQTLLHTLMNMFAKCQEDSDNYKLTYQDREGDWLFADQDVPWRTFTRSVQRLKLVKRSH